jgi:hypothetical protein
MVLRRILGPKGEEEGRAVAQAVRRWLPTAAARVRVRAACGVCGGQSGTGVGFLRVLRFFLPIFPLISPSSYSPRAGTIGHWWPHCRVDPIGLHPPLYQLKERGRKWQEVAENCTTKSLQSVLFFRHYWEA